MDDTTFRVLMDHEWFLGLPSEISDGLSDYLVQTWRAAGCRPNLSAFARAHASDLKARAYGRAVTVAEEARAQAQSHTAQRRYWAKRAAQRSTSQTDRYIAGIRHRHHTIEARRHRARYRAAWRAVIQLALREEDA